MFHRIYIHLAAALFLGLLSCNSEKKPGGNAGEIDSTKPVRGDWVRVWMATEPDNLNLHCHKSAGSGYILDNIHLSLYNIDPFTFEMIPSLVTKMPVISEDQLTFSFEIRKEAVWDNGSPITGNDVAFSVKAFRNPNVEDKGSRISFDFINDVVVDSVNPKKFTITTSYPYFKSIESLGSLQVGPEYLLDPNAYMKNFSVASLNVAPGSKEESALTSNADIIAFAKLYNSVDYGRNPELIVGAGAYKLESWVTGQTITLIRKKEWWGDKFINMGLTFEAWPDKIIYKIIPDRSTAFAGLKSEELDVLHEILPKEFKEAMKGGVVKDNYNLFSPDMYSVSMIGLNTRPPSSRPRLFDDVKVRRAMAHLINVKELIENVYFGFGKPAVGPISPNKGNMQLNDTLKPILFDFEKAKSLFAEAGWKDTNGDGWLDKTIDGKNVTFEADFMFGEGSATGMATALHMKENCEKAGVKIKIHPIAFATMADKLEMREFDMYGLTLSGNHFLTDMKQVFHSESYYSKGVNYFGFCNAEADKLMEDTRKATDPLERKKLYWRTQEIIYQEQPVIFLWYPQDRVAIHKRFVTAKANSLRPDFQPSNFWAPVTLQRFK